MVNKISGRDEERVSFENIAVFLCVSEVVFRDGHVIACVRLCARAVVSFVTGIRGGAMYARLSVS